MGYDRWIKPGHDNWVPQWLVDPGMGVTFFASKTGIVEACRALVLPLDFEEGEIAPYCAGLLAKYSGSAPSEP